MNETCYQLQLAFSVLDFCFSRTHSDYHLNVKSSNIRMLTYLIKFLFNFILIWLIFAEVKNSACFFFLIDHTVAQRNCKSHTQIKHNIIPEKTKRNKATKVCINFTKLLNWIHIYKTKWYTKLKIRNPDRSYLYV